MAKDLPANFTPADWPVTKPGKRHVHRRVIEEDVETGALSLEISFQYGVDDGQGGFQPLPGKEGQIRTIKKTGAQVVAVGSTVDAAAVKADLDQLTDDVLGSEGF